MAIIRELAEAIASNLRKGGYPTVTADEVLTQLDKSPQDRDIVGMFAHGMLADAGLKDDGSKIVDAED